jgi:hypothetical protein
MSSFALIRPGDDARAQQASDWADSVAGNFIAAGHAKSTDVDDLTPADRGNIVAALGSSGNLICYFGHGDEHSWLTAGIGTVRSSDFASATGKAVVSIACKTGRNLGPDAITAGVEAWLGFTINVAVIAPHKGFDPIGDAVVGGVSVLASGHTMQDSRDELYSELDNVATGYDNGKWSGHPGAALKYYAALAMRDHIVLHGTAALIPL